MPVVEAADGAGVEDYLRVAQMCHEELAAVDAIVGAKPPRSSGWLSAF